MKKKDVSFVAVDRGAWYKRCHLLQFFHEKLPKDSDVPRNGFPDNHYKITIIVIIFHPGFDCKTNWLN